MSQLNSNKKDDFQVVLLLSCFVGHPVCFLQSVKSQHLEKLNKNNKFKFAKELCAHFGNFSTFPRNNT